MFACISCKHPEITTYTAFAQGGSCPNEIVVGGTGVQENVTEEIPVTPEMSAIAETTAAPWTEATAVRGARSACVAMTHLKLLRREMLVFGEDQWAMVLCDRWGNCATDGHIVVVDGDKVMRMRRYCEMQDVGCWRK